MWASARSLGVWGHAPPGAFGRATASPQTRQMRCWLSSERTTNLSSPRRAGGVFKWVRASARNLGVGPCPAQSVWQGSGFAADQTNAMLATSNGGDKTPVKGNPLRLSGITAYAEKFSICGREMKCFFIRFSREYFPCTQRFFGVATWGWYHYPRRALHAVETLDARRSRRLICRFYAVSEFAPCGLNIPSAGTRHPVSKPRTQRLTGRNTTGSQGRW